MTRLLRRRLGISGGHEVPLWGVALYLIVGLGVPLMLVVLR